MCVTKLSWCDLAGRAATIIEMCRLKRGPCRSGIGEDDIRSDIVNGKCSDCSGFRDIVAPSSDIKSA